MPKDNAVRKAFEMASSVSITMWQIIILASLVCPFQVSTGEFERFVTNYDFLNRIIILQYVAVKLD